jgi:hypothetical protein
MYQVTFGMLHTTQAQAIKWIHKNNCESFAKRLVVFACVEGVMFS